MGGLKNSDDQGTWFDLRFELLKNGGTIASGEAKTVKGVTRNPGQAKEIIVTFGAIADPLLHAGDVLSLRLLTKVADSGGHANAVGLRAYYDAVSRASRFGATFAQTFQVAITSPAPGATVKVPSSLAVPSTACRPSPVESIARRRLVLISTLIDGARYVGTNPEILTDPFLGLAELSNGNFFITGVRFFGIRFRRPLPAPALNGITFSQIYGLLSLEP